MAQRRISPSICAIQRSLIQENSTAPKDPIRLLHSSARRLDDQPNNDAPSSTPPPQTRKARSVAALNQLTSLQNRRIVPRALARGSFISGQSDSQPGPNTQNNSGLTRTNAPNASRSPSTMPRSPPPPGQMVRAPAQLRVTRNADNMRGGPNLRGRNQGDNRKQRPRNDARGDRGDGGPKKRQKNKDKDSMPETVSTDDTDLSRALPDPMVLQLLRLQRKEWDRVPYEPKYVLGSFAANELIHVGREFFRGASPPVKVWGRLEKRIGVVGMHGAEAALKIRRVGDGDAEPFGQEEDVLYIREAETPKNTGKPSAT